MKFRFKQTVIEAHQTDAGWVCKRVVGGKEFTWTIPLELFSVLVDPVAPDSVNVCRTCGVDFVPRPHTAGRFCSRECVDDSLRRSTRVGDLIGCSWCSSPIYLTEKMVTQRRYLCPECKIKRRRKYPVKSEIKRGYRDAHNVMHRAIAKGLLTKQPCEVCASTNTEAHHEDYSRPLDVIWLCKPHHVEFDRARRKRLAAAQ